MTDSKAMDLTKSMIDFSTKLYNKSWIFGAAGGSVTMKNENGIYMSNPSISPLDLDSKDVLLFQDQDNLPKEFGQSSQICMQIYKQRSPGSIIHSLNKSVLLTSFLFNGAEFRIKNHPMIALFHEGSELSIPILENSNDLSDKLGQKLSQADDNLTAVLVRGGGLYVWGKDADHVFVKCEALHQMMEFSIEMEKLGLNEFTHMSNALTSSSAPVAVTPKETLSNGTNNSKAPAKTMETTKAATKTPIKDGRVHKSSPAGHASGGKNRGRGGGGNNRGGKRHQNRNNWQQQRKQMDILMNY